jgi:hypothetical protein
MKTLRVYFYVASPSPPSGDSNAHTVPVSLEFFLIIFLQESMFCNVMLRKNRFRKYSSLCRKCFRGVGGSRLLASSSVLPGPEKVSLPLQPKLWPF